MTLNFSVNDKLVIDGSNGMTPDLKTDWNKVDLCAPLSLKDGVVHPFVDGETFVGILSFKNIKNAEIDIVGVNSIEASYLKGGYFFNVICKEAVQVGDKVEPTAGGFKKAAADGVGVALTQGAVDGVILVRGGNY